jgi:hypothetical protein
LLGGKDAGHRNRVQRIGSQSVNRLRRHRHQPASTENLRRLPNRFLRLGGFKMDGINSQSQSLHSPIVALPLGLELPGSRSQRTFS